MVTTLESDNRSFIVPEPEVGELRFWDQAVNLAVHSRWAEQVVIGNPDVFFQDLAQVANDPEQRKALLGDAMSSAKREASQTDDSDHKDWLIASAREAGRRLFGIGYKHAGRKTIRKDRPYEIPFLCFSDGRDDENISVVARPIDMGNGEIGYLLADYWHDVVVSTRYDEAMAPREFIGNARPARVATKDGVIELTPPGRRIRNVSPLLKNLLYTSGASRWEGYRKGYIPFITLEETNDDVQLAVYGYSFSEQQDTVLPTVGWQRISAFQCSDQLKGRLSEVVELDLWSGWLSEEIYKRGLRKKDALRYYGCLTARLTPDRDANQIRTGDHRNILQEESLSWVVNGEGKMITILGSDETPSSTSNYKNPIELHNNRVGLIVSDIGTTGLDRVLILDGRDNVIDDQRLDGKLGDDLGHLICMDQGVWKNEEMIKFWVEYGSGRGSSS